jgi:hypothetical protein
VVKAAYHFVSNLQEPILPLAQSFSPALSCRMITTPYLEFLEQIQIQIFTVVERRQHILDQAFIEGPMLVLVSCRGSFRLSGSGFASTHWLCSQGQVTREQKTSGKYQEAFQLMRKWSCEPLSDEAKDPACFLEIAQSRQTQNTPS